jgi:hypothetical protein
MSLLALTVVAAVVVGALFLIRGPLRHSRDLVPCIGCGNQAVAVQSSAHDWGTLVVDHLGVHLRGRLRCTIAAGHANPDGQFYPVSCRGVSRSGLGVQLTAAHAGIEGDAPQYLSGPWSVSLGPVTRTLACLPSHWRHRNPCGLEPE